MPEEKAIATLDTPVDELEQKLVDEKAFYNDVDPRNEFCSILL